MIAPLFAGLASSVLCSGLPEGLRNALETQLPAWAQVMGTPAPSSAAPERIAAERSTASTTTLFLIERRLKVVVQKEDDRAWLIEATWCGEGTDRCDDVWKRTDEQWRSDKATANHTGYAVYRDSLRLAPSPFGQPIPALTFGKRKWDKALCEGSLCFAAALADSSVARAVFRPDGSVAWWDGGYILGRANEKELVHAYGLLRDKGRAPGGR